MIIIKLQGGLGNQMFQYAFGLSRSKELDCPLYFDLSFFERGNPNLTSRNYELNVFPVSINIASDKLINRFFHPTLIRRLINKSGINRNTVYRENTLRFNKEVFEIKPPAYFEGFWQNEQYFANWTNLIREAFIFRYPLNIESQRIAATLKENTVSIHVRRGDYISSKATNELHGVCTANYYNQAINMMRDKLPDPHFYFFSDEPDWVKKHLLPTVDNCTLVCRNKDAESWQDMALMSKCKHHVIANSSFSWWGAWLNPDKEKIVIAPQNWFNKKTDYFDDGDIVPKSWIQIPND